jgi:putative hydrolase of the HAD superfamily
VGGIATGRRVTGRVEVVALDGDDTLWHSESLFVDTQERFRELLRPWVDLDDDDIDRALLEVERGNLPSFGYGVKAFTLSLVETAVRVTGGRVDGNAVLQILELGKVLHDHPVQLLDGAREAVDALTDCYRVMIITKGDLLHQETKVARSGLADHLWRVEIVSEKDEATYQRILDRHGIEPAEFVMVGNSLRSDVLPVRAIGGCGVHIPYHVTWELERAEASDDIPVLESLRDLPGWLLTEASAVG